MGPKFLICAGEQEITSWGGERASNLFKNLAKRGRVILDRGEPGGEVYPRGIFVRPQGGLRLDSTLVGDLLYASEQQERHIPLLFRSSAFQKPWVGGYLGIGINYTQCCLF